MGPRAGECARPSPGKVAVPVWGGGRALLLCLLAGRSATLAFLGVRRSAVTRARGPGDLGIPFPPRPIPQPSGTGPCLLPWRALLVQRSEDLGDPWHWSWRRWFGPPPGFCFSCGGGREGVRVPCGPDHVFVLAWRISGYLIDVTFSPSSGTGEPEGKQSHLLPLEQVCKAPGIESKSPNLSPASRSSPLKPQSPKIHLSGLPSVFVGVTSSPSSSPSITFPLCAVTSQAPPGSHLFSPSPSVGQQRHGTAWTYGQGLSRAPSQEVAPLGVVAWPDHP